MGRPKLKRFSELEEAEQIELAELAEPEPDIPHAAGVMFGSQVGWSPMRENQDAENCKICGGPGGLIDEGSGLYCAGCRRSGNERLAAKLLREYPPPVHGLPGPWEDESKPKRTDAIERMRAAIAQAIARQAQAGEGLVNHGGG